MSLQSFRHRVLSIFKQLHKTRKAVFNEDLHAQGVARNKINEEFRKHKDVSDAKRIEELLVVAKEAECALRETVVQAKYNPETGSYRAKITKDTVLSTNKPFDPNAKLPKRGRRSKCEDTPS